MDEEREWIRRAMAGDHDAFAQLMRRHQSLVWHIVQRMVGQPEDTRELSQEVFLRMHQRLGQFRFESSLATWIGRIAFSIAVRHLQRKRLPMVVADEDDDGDVVEQLADDVDIAAEVAEQEQMARVQQALDQLPPLPRTVVTLYHLDELSVAEIGRICDMPVGTVKNTLFRARRRLRDALLADQGEAS